jgi:hypothetical protein
MNPNRLGKIMTTFTKANLTSHRGNVEYRDPSGPSKFVARFKYGSAGTFMTLLRKKFTVEEYFARLDAGESPLPIAQSKGYISPHIKKWLKQGGYPVTQAGYKLMIADQAAYRAKAAAATQAA